MAQNIRLNRLLDIVHADQKLYLVFEFLDVDLKRYMDVGNKSGNPISLDLVKVSHSLQYCARFSVSPSSVRRASRRPVGHVKPKYVAFQHVCGQPKPQVIVALMRSRDCKAPTNHGGHSVGSLRSDLHIGILPKSACINAILDRSRSDMWRLPDTDDTLARNSHISFHQVSSTVIRTAFSIVTSSRRTC